MNCHLQYGSEKPLLWRHLVVENSMASINIHEGKVGEHTNGSHLYVCGRRAPCW